MCEQMLTTKACKDKRSFARDFLAKLLLFRNEKVPNIRVLLARLIFNHFVNSGETLERS